MRVSTEDSRQKIDYVNENTTVHFLKLLQCGNYFLRFFGCSDYVGSGKIFNYLNFGYPTLVPKVRRTVSPGTLYIPYKDRKKHFSKSEL